MFTCISCRVAFDSPEEQRSHFSTDWHRYNMKRRIASLPPLAALAFNEKVTDKREQNAVRTDPRSLSCLPCNKLFSSENAFRSHVQSKRHRERELLRPQGSSGVGSEPILHSSQSNHLLDQSNPLAETTCDVPQERESGRDGTMEQDGDTETEFDGIEDRLASARRHRHKPSDCLFCIDRFSSVDGALTHMNVEHSFFIPDQEHLTDLPGLLAYLGEKVVIGNICLYCPNGGKEFRDLSAVRRHMKDKAHCKVAYESDEDRAELADFYDFDAVDEDWEDIDEVDMLDGDGLEAVLPRLHADGLSLRLPSGRVLGHRSLRVYYEQQLRPTSASNSHSELTAAKVARIKARMSDPATALVPLKGGVGAFGKGLQVVKARNAGEAKWARKQGNSFLDQSRKRHHEILVGFKHNNQKHFRDPLRRSYIVASNTLLTIKYNDAPAHMHVLQI